MNTQATRAAPASTHLAVLFHDSALALRSLAKVLDRWFAGRRRAEQDWQDLANMSDRELSDIGLTRGNFDAPRADPRSDLPW
jgi:uncharacterized protein YjiS (DUF1127 family)